MTGFLVGLSSGIFCHHFFSDESWLTSLINNIAQPMGQAFLRLIFMVVVPLVFSSIVLGIFEMGDLNKLGKVGLYSGIYSLITSTLSVLVGVLLVVVLKPGKGLDLDLLSKLGVSQNAGKVLNDAAATKPLSEILVNLIPKNPLHAASHALEGEMISFMIFSMLFGIALAMVRADERTDPLVGVLESLRDLSMKIIDFAMALAPFGIGGLMFAMAARFGWDLLPALGKYVGVVLLGLALQQFVVLGLAIKFFTRFSPFEFFRLIREVLITAFSTASSNATLPTSLRVSIETLKLDRKISSFVLTVGATANQHGTALFEGITVLFLAQLFGVDLSLSQQFFVVVMSVVAGIGTAGVPGGSIPFIVLLLQSINVPAEGIAVILGVDRLLDMCRTVLNVTGDIVGAAVVEHWVERKDSNHT